MPKKQITPSLPFLSTSSFYAPSNAPGQPYSNQPHMPSMYSNQVQVATMFSNQVHIPALYSNQSSMTAYSVYNNLHANYSGNYPPSSSIRPVTPSQIQTGNSVSSWNAPNILYTGTSLTPSPLPEPSLLIVPTEKKLPLFLDWNEWTLSGTRFFFELKSQDFCGFNPDRKSESRKKLRVESVMSESTGVIRALSVMLPKDLDTFHVHLSIFPDDEEDLEKKFTLLAYLNKTPVQVLIKNWIEDSLDMANTKTEDSIPKRRGRPKKKDSTFNQSSGSFSLDIKKWPKGFSTLEIFYVSLDSDGSVGAIEAIDSIMAFPSLLLFKI